MADKLCKDCVNFNGGALCNRDISKTAPDYIFGGTRELNSNAQQERETGDCGPQGKHFKKREHP